MPDFVLGRDRREDFLGGVTRDQGCQWRGIPQGVVVQAREHTALDINVPCVMRGVDLAQGVVVFRAEKGQGRLKRAGTDPGNYLEVRSRARFAPATQESSPEGAVRTAAGKCQQGVLAHPVLVRVKFPGTFIPERLGY